VVVEKVYKRSVKDTTELRERIVTARNELDQRIIDTAVSRWRTRNRACVGQSSGWTFRTQTVTCCIRLVVRTL